MADIQIDAAIVVRKYQEQLSQAMHTVVMLQAQVETLQASLAQAQSANGGATSTTKPPAMDVLKTGSQPSSD